MSTMSSRTLRSFLSTLRQFSGGLGYRSGGRIQLRSTSRSLTTGFYQRGRHNQQGLNITSLMGVAALAASGIGVMNYFGRDEKESGVFFLPRIQAAENKGEESQKPKVSLRERRYKLFASVVYDGEPYMTPRDFIESLIQDQPRSRCILHDSFLILSLLLPPPPPSLSLSLSLSLTHTYTHTHSLTHTLTHTHTHTHTHTLSQVSTQTELTRSP